MKTFYILTLLIYSPFGYSQNRSQTVFTYDASGNRTSAKFLGTRLCPESYDCMPSLMQGIGNVSDNIYKVGTKINSKGTITSTSAFQAGNSITLEPGFVATSGTVFEAKIQGCITAPTKDLVLHLPFSGNSNDVSGNNFHATTSGNVTFSTRSGGQSLNITANSNQYAIIPNNSLLQNMNQMTLSAWVKPTTFDLACYAEKEVLIGKGKDVSSKSFAMVIVRNTQASCGSTTNFSTYKIGFELNNNVIFSPIYTTDNKWCHVVCTYDGQIQKLYINGVLAQQQNIGTINTSNFYQIYLNYTILNNWASNSNGRYGGGFDEIRIYSRALVEDEVQRVFLAER